MCQVYIGEPVFINGPSIFQYTLTHEHRHGTSVYAFYSSKTLEELPSQEEIAEILGVEYEPYREEYLDLEKVSLEDFDTLCEEYKKKEVV